MKKNQRQIKNTNNTKIQWEKLVHFGQNIFERFKFFLKKKTEKFKADIAVKIKTK